MSTDVRVRHERLGWNRVVRPDYTIDIPGDLRELEDVRRPRDVSTTEATDDMPLFGVTVWTRRRPTRLWERRARRRLVPSGHRSVVIEQRRVELPAGRGDHLIVHDATEGVTSDVVILRTRRLGVVITCVAWSVLLVDGESSVERVRRSFAWTATHA